MTKLYLLNANKNVHQIVLVPYLFDEGYSCEPACSSSSLWSWASRRVEKAAKQQNAAPNAVKVRWIPVTSSHERTLSVAVTELQQLQKVAAPALVLCLFVHKI